MLLLVAWSAGAQVNPPVPAPSGPVNPAGVPSGAPMPILSPTAMPAPGTAASPMDATTPSPIPTPTLPPISVDPATIAVEPNHTSLARVNGSLGAIAATVADPAIASLVLDQQQRAVFVTGHAVGSTTVTIRDDRGVTSTVSVRVAFAAGSAADTVAIRLTGDPASNGFLRDAIAQAATSAATLRPGAVATINGAFTLRGDLKIDDRLAVDVPVRITGQDYFNVDAVTHVEIENYALPHTAPQRLFVSDYPERLTANGVLFTADLDRTAAQRFLYYHFNPTTEPDRRVLVKLTNASAVPALVQMISGSSGPGANEMEVGHNSTKAFLVRERRNEGVVMTIPPNATVNIVNHHLAPGTIVSALLQLREVSGDPLKLAIVAQDASAPLDQSVDTTNLLAGGALHARGVYPVPEFSFDYPYYTDGPQLEIPIGQLPLPNLREGEALSGDYGVMQTMRVVIVNASRYGQNVALYANPRGGAATGTFLIDNTLVQAHRLPTFSKYKIWQETINGGSFRTLQIVTMPEGGSSYPLRLIFAADDGSVAPGAPGSPVY